MVSWYDEFAHQLLPDIVEIMQKDRNEENVYNKSNESWRNS